MSEIFNPEEFQKIREETFSTLHKIEEETHTAKQMTESSNMSLTGINMTFC